MRVVRPVFLLENRNIEMQFHKSLLVPAIRRLLYFISAICIVVLLSFVAGKESWWIPSIAALVFVLIETIFYNSKRSFFPPVVTFRNIPTSTKAAPAASAPAAPAGVAKPAKARVMPKVMPKTAKAKAAAKSKAAAKAKAAKAKTAGK